MSFLTLSEELKSVSFNFYSSLAIRYSGVPSILSSPFIS
nr:MAG TPA: hypothetical protein [Bacteriophage sp.]